MDKKKNIEPEEEPSLADKMLQSPFFVWIANNTKQAVGILASVVVVAVLLLYVFYARSNQDIQRLTMSQAIVANLRKYPRIVDNIADGAEVKAGRKSIEKLQKLVDESADLQKRYDGMIAQERILMQDVVHIAPYANRAATELRDVGLDNYADFSLVAKLSGESQFKEALDRANTLYEAIEANEGEKAAVLRAFVLLQTAFLQQKLGKIEAAKETIQKLKMFLAVDDLKHMGPEEKEKITKIAGLLEDTHITLFEYLDEELLQGST